MKKVLLTLTEDGNIIYGATETSWESDIEITQSDIDSLVETEMEEGCHSDYIEDYNSELEFYLSNVERDDYTEYIKDRLDDKQITTELANEIKELVVEQIKNKF